MLYTTKLFKETATSSTTHIPIVNNPSGGPQLHFVYPPLKHITLTCCSSSELRVLWHCGRGTSWIRRAACAWSSCCYHNQCLASASDPWIACGPCCQYPWASSSFSKGITAILKTIYRLKKTLNLKQNRWHLRNQCQDLSYQLTAILTYRSDWCLMNFFVLFFTILGFVRGLRATMVTANKTSKMFYVMDKMSYYKERAHR